MARWNGRLWMQERKWETRLALGLALGVGILLGTLISGNVTAALDSGPSAGKPLAVPSPVELSTTFSGVAQAVEPAVVNISSEVTGRRRSRDRRQPQVPSPFEDFFDRFREPPRSQSFGSGVVVDAAGYVLTNYHVIEGADQIRVRVAGESKEFTAEVVGTDEDTDLAVIKIEAGHKLAFARLGNSDAVQVGDWVLAIGSPFQLSATVTAGIISHKGRSGQQELFDQNGQFKRYLQTDAAINRGNSGGPLVNMMGEVIGINTAIMSRTGWSAGIGFAMPSNIAITVYNQILKHGRVIRGSIGITFSSEESENPAILRVYGAQHGVMVQEVTDNGPAARAGLRRADIITHIDETPIRVGDDLINKVTSTAVGTEIRIRYIRDKEAHETTALVEDFRRVHAERYASADVPAATPTVNARLGVSLQDLTSTEAAEAGLEEENIGPIVQHVEPGSFADDIGLAAGDVILEINRERVRSKREFQAVQQGIGPGSDVVFLILRKAGRRQFVTLYRAGTLPK